MTKQQLGRLHPGNVIQSKLTGLAYVVIAQYGTYALAVDVAHVQHADEWDLLYTSTLKKVSPSPRRSPAKKG